MIKIKYCAITQNENDEDVKHPFNASIEPIMHIIKIKKDTISNIIAPLYYNMCGYNIKLYDNKNKKILLHNVEFIKETPQYSFYKFELLIIGTHNISEQISNINKAIIKFTLPYNFKLFNKYNDFLKCQIENNIKVEITNSKIILYEIDLNEDQIKDIIINIFEIISIIYGSFPIVNYFEFFTQNQIITKYSEQKGYLNTSEFDIDNSQNLFSYIHKLDFSKVYNLYNDIKLKLNKLPLQGLFIAQSNSQYYIDYKLVTILQSLEGLCSKFYVEEVKDNDSITQSKFVIRALRNFLNKYQTVLQCTNNLKEKIYSSLGYINKIDLRNYLKYLLKKEYSQIIFNTEIQAKEETKFILPIKEFISVSINERNKLSHMDINPKKRYFTIYQSTVAYNKLKLLYRCAILEILEITISEQLLSKSVNFIENTHQ